MGNIIPTVKYQNFTLMGRGKSLSLNPLDQVDNNNNNNINNIKNGTNESIMPKDVPWCVIGEDSFTAITNMNHSKRQQQKKTNSKLGCCLYDTNFLIQFAPLHDGLYTTTLLLIRKNLVYNLICIGRAGLGSLTSNYGTPSKPGVRRPPINLGVFHCDVITTREIIVTNNGTLDIRILNVTACINDVAVQKKKKKNDGSSVDSASSSSLEYNWCLPTNIRDIETGIDLVENNIVQFGTEYTKYQSPQDASSRDSNNNSNSNKNKNKNKKKK